MKKLWKIALVAVIALFLAVPMTLLGGCKANEKYDVKFVVSNYDETEVVDNQYGTISCDRVDNGAEKRDALTLNEIKYNSEIKIDGNVITVGRLKVKATPTTNTTVYTYSFVEWKVSGNKITEETVIKAVFKKEKAWYNIIYDVGDVEINETLPTNHKVQVNNNESKITLPTITAVDGTKMLKRTSSKSGWSLNPAQSQGGSSTLNPVSTIQESQLTASTNRTSVDVENRTITIHAIWTDLYVTVKVSQATGEYEVKNTGTKSNPNYEAASTYTNWINSGVKIELRRGDDTIATSTDTDVTTIAENKNTYTFKLTRDQLFSNIATLACNSFEIWAETYLGSGVMVNTGVTVNPTFSGGMSNQTAWAQYSKVVVSGDNLDEVTGYDADTYYAQGTTLTLTATAAEGYSVTGWQRKNLVVGTKTSGAPDEEYVACGNTIALDITVPGYTTTYAPDYKVLTAA